MARKLTFCPELEWSPKTELFNGWTQFYQFYEFNTGQSFNELCYSHMLCILTSKRVLHTPLAHQNIFFCAKISFSIFYHQKKGRKTQKSKKTMHKKGVYQRLGVTLKQRLPPTKHHAPPTTTVNPKINSFPFTMDLTMRLYRSYLNLTRPILLKYCSSFWHWKIFWNCKNELV